MDFILEALNEKQKEAVINGDGYVLINAGPGSGKTRVITHRIAYLLFFKKVPPSQILAVTFTNKAADEMKERIEKLVGRSIPFLTIGTFHSVCSRILRSFIDRLDKSLNRNFTIADSDYSKTLISNILKEKNLRENFNPSEVLEYFSFLKRSLKSPIENKILNDCFQIYNQRLLQSNALDFDDLLIYTLKLLKENEDVKKIYTDKFKYVLVDEYQDTNEIQDEILNILTSKWKNLFVVGDEDQSIYSFRGSDINLIVNFKKRYLSGRVINLEENYRSFNIIVKAATKVVEKNRIRLGKNIWSRREGNEKIKFFYANSERDEASFVAKKIKELSSIYSFDQFAILMRVISLTRIIEEALSNFMIPYKIVGGIKFYERKEIKDILSYFVVALNPNDTTSLMRILNVPLRGIGLKKIDKLKEISNEKRISLYSAIKYSIEEKVFPKNTLLSLQKFIEIIEKIKDESNKKSIYSLAKWLIDEIRYFEYLKDFDPITFETRKENLFELLSALKEFEEKGVGDLITFLERGSLRSDQDELSEIKDKTVKVMTIHSAKGLEFPVVFVVGVEDGLIPHHKSRNREEDMEEERRVFYVALTRAKEKLILSASKYRIIAGILDERKISPFLKDMEDFLEPENGSEKGDSLKRVFSNNLINLLKEQDKEKENDIKVGTKLLHEKFGKGIVLSTQGKGDSQYITIFFDKFGKKIFLKRILINHIKIL